MRDSEYKRMAFLKETYEPICKNLYEEALTRVTHTKLGRGGCTLHRGVLCPSLVRNIIICNCNRGKLLKRTKGINTPDYIYMFDKDDNLILVTTFPGNKYPYYELLIHEDDNIIGIEFRDQNGRITLSRVSEECYENGRIVSYAYGSFNFDSIDLTSERYAYHQDMLEVDYYYGESAKYSNVPLSTLINDIPKDLIELCPEIIEFVDISKIEPTRKKYIFKVEKGYLESFTIQTYEDKSDAQAFWTSNVFEVPKSKKRKI